MTPTGPASRPSPRGRRRAGRGAAEGRHGPRAALLGLGAGALLLGAGAWTWAAPSEGPVAEAGRVPTAAATTATTGSEPTPAAAAAPRVAPAAGRATQSAAAAPTALPTLTAAATSFVPTRLQIPAIDVDSAVTPVGVTEGELGVPDDPSVLGWWRGGARPGSGLGTVVVDGHVDSRRYGTGPLYRAPRLTIGDTATVSGGDGQQRTYRVVALRTYLKATLPAQEIFTQAGPERLVVVTCGGAYHRGQGGWDSNVVVYLEPTR
ncbi:MAG: class F sortase [Motilibacteraceae bacterium]